MYALAAIIDKYPDLATEIVGHAESLWVISKPDGSVLWANNAFVRFIGYSLIEFTRKERPIVWQDITLHDENLEADLENVNACIRGEIKEYRVRKFYVPKKQNPVLVDLFVRRFPREGPLDFFIVEVFPLVNGNATAARNYEELSRKMLAALTQINEQLYINNSTGLNAFVRYLVEHPKVGVPVAFFIGALLFGNRAIEIIGQLRSIFIP